MPLHRRREMVGRTTRRPMIRPVWMPGVRPMGSSMNIPGVRIGRVADRWTAWVIPKGVVRCRCSPD